MLVTFLRTVDCTHVSLREAIERVRPDREFAVIQLAHDALRKLGVEPQGGGGRLDPHADESGLFGTEDTEQIAPAIEEARRAEGIDASGPHLPDTVLMRARRDVFDIVEVQYHDQGHIPIKLMASTPASTSP